MARLAIEFDDSRILLAVMQTASRHSPLKNATVIEADSNDDAALIESLREGVQKLGLAKSDAIVVAGRGDIELRILNVPPAPKNELPDIVKFVAKNEFASLNDSWVIDYVRLSGDENVAGQVMAAGISPDKKNRFEKIINDAGLRLKGIALRPFGVANFLADKIAAAKSSVVVEPYGQQADIILTNGTKVVAARSIRLAGTDAAQTLAREIKRTMASSGAGFSVDGARLLMIGPAESTKPIGDSIGQTLSMESEIVDLLADSSLSGELGSVENANRFVAHIGALVKQDESSIDAIDFANPRQPIVEKRDYSKWKVYGAIAAAVACSMVGFGWWTLSNQSAEIEQRREALASITSKNEGNMGRPAVAETLEKVGSVDKWVSGTTNWQEVLLAYSQNALTADDAIVDRFEGRFTGKSDRIKIDVTARSADNKAEASLIQELQKEFEVAGTSNKILEGPEYTSQSILQISKVEDAKAKVKQIDKRAEAYLKQLRDARAAAAKQSANPDSAE